MAKKSKKPSKEKVNDVSKPGETPASSNARPTITGHSPVIKSDPMVAFSSRNESEEEIQESNEKNSYVTKSRAKISPVSKDLTGDKEKKNESDSEEEETIVSGTDKDAGKDAEKDTETAKTEDSDEKTSSVGSDSAAIDTLAQTADAKKAESKQEEEEKKHREYIDGLSKNGKYRLPIIEGGHKGSAERLVSWVFLLLLIASIGVYIAIDAGYINIGFDLPFELIKN